MARRSGGRAARVAKRQAPPVDAPRAIRPGMIGGAYRPLSDGQMTDMVDAALGLLEELGMGQATPEFIELVTAAGGTMGDDGRLRFPRQVVLRAIDTAAKEFVLHGFDDDSGIEIGGDRVHFATGGAAVMILDHRSGRFRESTLRDLYDLARLADTLDNIHLFVRPVVTRDLESARDVDLNTAFVTMLGTSKPIGTSMFEPRHVHEVAAMFDLALGGEGEFRKRPFCKANNTFVVPPLRFAEDSALCLAEQVRVGMPINLLSAGQAGATSPAALAGSLVQALAECLAGLTCVNLLSPGHPCVMGLWPFVSDLRTGAMSGGSGEEAVLNAAAAQLANHLGLPSGVAAGMADSKIPDAQAGYEKGQTVALAANAGANLVYESAGMLASIMACSPEMMVIDNDLLGSVNRTVRGIEVTPETMSTSAIAEVIGGEGHFLGHPQTLAMMQTEYVYPEVGDRLSPDDWIDAGASAAADRANGRVEAVLSSHVPSHVPADRIARICDAFPIRLEVPAR
ncbi:MAG: trimethylamine methyltransferase family protein [Actinomycetota bacterium]